MVCGTIIYSLPGYERHFFTYGGRCGEELDFKMEAQSPSYAKRPLKLFIKVKEDNDR